MATLGADYLFANIPLEEISDICFDNLYNGIENHPNIQSMIVAICLTKPPKKLSLCLKTNIINK